MLSSCLEEVVNPELAALCFDENGQVAVSLKPTRNYINEVKFFGWVLFLFSFLLDTVFSR